MANLARLRCPWSGSPVVGPGLSTFYFDPADVGAADAVFDFFTATGTLLYPTGLSITVPSSGDIINDVNGELTGTWSDPGTGGVFTGTNTGDFFAGVGMRVRWLTNGIFRGRRTVGSTFLAPIAAAISDTSGTIDNATVTSVQAAAAGLVTSGVDFRIWSRPGPTFSGQSSLIVEAQTPDKTSWLRSRRV